MVQLIVGEKGKGKTKILLERANAQIKTVSGNIVYIDKSKQHMYELNNRIRLIDITGYKLDNTDQFLGFVSGIVSQDNDLEQVYLDSFLTIAAVSDTQNVALALDKINAVSEAFSVDFVISISVLPEDLPEKYQSAIIEKC